MNTISDYFEQAQLSMAAYAEGLQRGMFGSNILAYVDALEAAGMSEKQAEIFADTYSVVDQFTDFISGFSGTVFEKDGNIYFAIRGTETRPFSIIQDWLTNIADVGADGIAITQGLVMFNWLQRLEGASGQPVVQYVYHEASVDQDGNTVPAWIESTLATANGLLSASQASITVTGHSLGGHLAMMLSRMAPSLFDAAYTYMAPGFDTTVRDTSPLTSDGFFSLLRDVSVGPITGPVGAAWDETILSHLDVPGDIVHNVGNTPGLQEGFHAPFSENANQGPYDAHSKVQITDALAVYNLLGSLNSSLALSDITPILQAGANTPEESLEGIVNALGDLLGVGTQVGTDDRNALYARIQAIQAELIWYPQIALTSLHDDPPEAIATAAKADKGFLYALEHLNPFAVVGDDFLYTGLDLAQFSDSYREDRARLLKDKLARAIVDNTDSQDSGPYDGTAVHFIDKDSQYDVRILPSSPGLRIEFGSDKPGIAGEDTLTGTVGVDHLYGRGSDDRLEGGRGNDHLEGGQGTDTYVYNSGDGFDTIFDSDGVGQIVFNETITLSGGMQTAAGASTWYDEVNDIRYSLDTAQANGLLTITQGADSFQVRDFQSDQLGITLQLYSETPFVDPDSYEAIYLAVPASATKLSVHKDQEIWGLDENYWLVLGGSGNHIVHAGSGDDVVFEDWTGDVPPPDYSGEFPVGPSDDIFYGEAGRDALEAGDGNDRLFGGTEQDLLAGMGDDDYLEGNAGDDVLTGGAGQDTLKGGTGNDDLWGDADWSTVDPSWTVSRTGTFKVDLRFAYSADIGGTDISANDDIDELYGGAGDDVLLGGGGDDLMFGEADQDTLFGQYGNDYLDGGAGDDHLRGDIKVGTLIDDPENLGHDVLIGGSGNDLLEGGFGDDVLYGGADNDVLQGDFDIKPEWAGDDYLDGGQGGDDLQGGLGNDTLIGGEGDDTLDGGQGDDQLEGDAGSDVYVINANDGNDVVLDRDTAPNTDRVAFGPGLSALQARLARSGSDLVIGFADAANSVTLKNYFLGLDYEIEEISFSSGVTWTPETIKAAFSQVPEDGDLIIGPGYGATIFGDAGNNVILGGEERDYLYGQAGDDVLVGGGGDDELIGTGWDAGKDTYIGGAGNDSFFDRDVDSHDTYVFDLGDGQDLLQDSGGGFDVLRFGPFITPADVYVSHDQGAGDLVVGIRGTREGVRVDDFFNADHFTGALVNQIERIEFDDGSAWDLQQILGRIEATPATAFDDDIHGTDAGETLDALAGNDVVSAYGGDDTLFGGAGDDSLSGGDGNDQVYGGAGNDTFGGDAGDDVLYGGEGNDIFWGEGDGDDTISGGPGDDYARSWVGDDTYLYDPGDEGQTVLDFSGYDRLVFGAGIVVSDLVFAGDTGNPFATLSITVTGNPGTIELERWAGEGRIEEFVFADGTHLAAAQVNALANGETVALDEKPPVVNQPVADRAIKVDTPFAFTLPGDMFSDPNPGDTLSLTATLPEGRALPSWLAFDPLTRTFTGTPGSADAGTLTVEVRATDPLGFSVKDKFTLTVRDSADQNLVSGTTGDDNLAGTTGADLMVGGDGNDQLSGNDGNDVLIGGSGQDTLDGGAGNDTLITGTGGSTVFGGAGDDTLLINGSDLIDTGAGNNTLWFASNPGGASVVTAGSGDNHYIFSSSFGSVTIGGSGGGTGGGAAQRPVATFSGYDSSSGFSFGLGSLVIRAEDGSELHLTDFDPDDVYGFTTIGSFRFRDGVERSYAEFISQGFDIAGSGGADVLSGTNIIDRMEGLDGDDSLSGDEGDDVLNGGLGNDTLRGGDGDDTYVFNLGDGVDTLIDASTAAEANRIRFGAGIELADINVSLNGNSLTIAVGAGGDVINLEHQDPVTGDVSQIVATLEFDDGSEAGLAQLIPEGEPREPIIGTALSDVMIGTSGDDWIDAGDGHDIVVAGMGDDIVSGGAGRDLLFGGGGDDRFVVNGSDRNHDLFYGGPGSDDIIGGAGDDTIRLHRFDRRNSIESIDGGAGVDRIVGTEGDDVIDFSATAVSNIDRIDAGGGNDTLTGTGGSDRFIGGGGTDTLRGGAGSDVYLFDRGDGPDRISDLDPMANSDLLQLGATIQHDQLWFSRVGDDLNIEVIGTSDEVVIERWYTGADNQIELFQTGDGFTLLNTRVDQLVQAMAAFTPPAGGELDLSAQLRSDLEPVLAASWEAA